MYSTLIIASNEGLLNIVVNRPDKLNALNTTVLEELKKVVQLLRDDPALKGAIITGAGEKSFVAGADIAGFLQVDRSKGEELAKRGQEIFSMIEKTEKPILAAVNGYALGGGCELAMSCHFRYAAENARFGQPEINLGIIPGYGGTQRLPKLIGKGRGLEMMMRGDSIDAAEAYRIGLVNKVLPAEKLMQEAEATMRLIISKPSPAIAALIRATNAGFEDNGLGFDQEAKAFAKAFSTDEMVEGVTAFLEKRKPNFK
jgi:enoyl-CoA hydratase